MATKTITIMEDAYEGLIENKETEESFSDVIRRLTVDAKKKHRLIELYGILSKKEGDSILEDISKQKEYSMKEEAKRSKGWKF